MQITLTNTLTRRKEPFVPADPSRVTMYVCGPTVYSYAHIGNARPPVVFDVLFRLLRYQYGESAVIYARNYTDIDDRIIAAANESGEPISVITEKFARIYEEDTAALGVLKPTLTPRATTSVPAMIALIEQLLAKGAAYKVTSGVYFSVAADSDYGKLSGRSQDDVKAGARVEAEDDKRHPSDFALWKTSKPGEPSWEAPFGAGRPGWHIECSAMIEEVLGSPIDIHGGGVDLIFPHHENEIAQSETAHGRRLAQVWMHNGFLTMDAAKMSKSIGNIITPRELLEQGWQGETIRWALLSAHYRAPLDWSDGLLRQAQESLNRLYGTLDELKDVKVAKFRSSTSERDFDEQVWTPLRADVLDQADVNWLVSGLLWQGSLKRRVRSGHLFAVPVLRSLCDDLNTPAALSKLFAVADAVRKVEFHSVPLLKRVLLECGALLGLLQQDPDVWFGRKIQGAVNVTLEGVSASGGGRVWTAEYIAEVNRLVARRAAARAAKNYAESDRIRAELESRGVEVLDGAAGSTWRRRT